jgi:uncharacterized protein (TIGR01777 family)
MLQSRKVLIVGGSGMLGQALAESLLLADFQVRITTRDEVTDVNHERMLPKDLKLVHWSAKRVTPELLEAVEWAGAVVNLAGASISDKRWTEKYKQLMVSSRVQTTKLLAEAVELVKDKPIVFVNASAIGYYGDTSTATDENSGPGKDFLADLCRTWEEAAEPVAKHSRLVFLRTGIVLSPNGGFLQEVLPLFELGLGGRFGNGKQWFSWIHLDDWVGAAKAIIINPWFKGPINVTSPFPVTNKHFVKLLSNTVHLPAFLRYPQWLLTIAVGKASSGLFLSQQILPNKLLKAGFKFKFPQLAAALSDLVP